MGEKPPRLGVKEDFEKATSIGIIPFKESFVYLELALRADYFLLFLLFVLFIILIPWITP